MEPNQRVNQTLGKMVWNNFMGGIAWGLGVTVGLSIILGSLGYFGSKIDWVPFIGNFVKQITNSLENNKPTIKKPSP